MGTQVIIDNTRLNAEMSRFIEFVRHRNREDYGIEDSFISFRDTNGFLGEEESYKSKAAEKARAALQSGKWKEDWIGTGKIAACAEEAVDAADNLVYYNQKIKFRDKLNSNHDNFDSDAERTLYEIYRGNNDKEAFARAVDVFGGNYDLIAFLFFIKDDTCYLPISSGHFDESFKKLGIDYSMSGKCTWDNYQGYISIVSAIQNELKAFLPVKEAADIRLIDAHSFVWIIHEDKYISWDPDKETTARIEQIAECYNQRLVEGSGGKKESTYEGYIRSQKVVDETKRRAHGSCQLCGKPAPFKDKNGVGYLEAHHVDWLSRGGKDGTDNTVALCPNCHTKMHVVDDPADVQFLKDVIAKMMVNGNGIL